MKYLGIDYGEKRIGTAVSNAEGTIAFPRTTIANDTHVVDFLKKLIDGEKIGSIVIGDARSHGGAENPVTKKTEQFMEILGKETSLPVLPAFEAWSSIEASRYTDGEKDDASAAAIILQRYLDGVR